MLSLRDGPFYWIPTFVGMVRGWLAQMKEHLGIDLSMPSHVVNGGPSPSSKE